MSTVTDLTMLDKLLHINSQNVSKSSYIYIVFIRTKKHVYNN